MFARTLDRTNHLSSVTSFLFLCVLSFTGLGHVSGQTENDINPYPETPEEIERYKSYLIQKRHKESNYPKKPTRISTLKELFRAARTDNVHVKMEPGIYKIDVDNYKDLWDGGGSLLKFLGNHSAYDLRGVEIRIDTYLNHTNSFIREVRLAGDHMILRGLTVRMIGNYPPMREDDTNWGLTWSQGGNYNLLQDVTIHSRGSKPYGYGHALMLGNKSKRGAVHAGGKNNVYVDFDIYQRASGHALKLRRASDHVWINSHIEGEIRMSDDILNNKSAGSSYSADLDPTDIIGDKMIDLNPDRVVPVPLIEDAFRSYGNGNTLKVLGGTVKNLRSAFKFGGWTEVFISNVMISGIPYSVFRNFGIETQRRIVNCSMDLGCGTVELIGSRVELVVHPNPFKATPTGYRMNKFKKGVVTGYTTHRDGAKILLVAGKGLNPKRVKQVRRNRPIVVRGSDQKIRNETGIPILLKERTENCTVVTNGPVVDNGENNTIKRIE